MNRNGVVIAAFAAMSVLLASQSSADGINFQIKLPNCPGPLTLSAPGIFAGAKQQQWMIDQIANSPSARDVGTIVLAVTAPLQPSILLMVGERNDIGAIQGKATRKQFDDLKAAILAADASTEIGAANQRGGQEGITFSNARSFSTSSNADSVTAIGLFDGSVPGADFTSYIGVLTGYTQKCIASAIVMAPASSLSRETFETLMRSLSIE